MRFKGSIFARDTGCPQTDSTRGCSRDEGIAQPDPRADPRAPASCRGTQRAAASRAPTRSGVPDGRASRTACPEPRCSRSTRESTAPSPPRGRIRRSCRCGDRGSAPTSCRPATSRSSRSAGCPTQGEREPSPRRRPTAWTTFLAGRSMSANEAGRGLGVHPNALRYAAPTGRVLIRWDGANRPTIWTVPAPKVDPLDARAELARRYLHVLGPGTPETFAEWAGIKPPRGRAAFEAIADVADRRQDTDRRRMDPRRGRSVLPRFVATKRPRSTPPQRRRLLPAPGVRSRAPGAAGGPPERPVDLPRLAGRGADRRRSRRGLATCQCRSHDSAVAPGLSVRNASPWKPKRRRSRSPASRARSACGGMTAANPPA